MFVPCRGASFAVALMLGLVVSWSAASEEGGRTVRVAAYENPPLVYEGAGGVVDGVFIHILRGVAAARDWDLEIRMGGFEEGLDRLRSGDADIMPAVARTERRGADIHFSDEPLLANWAHILAGEHSDIRELTDLAGTRIAVVDGDVYVEGEQGLRSVLDSFRIAAELVPVRDYPTAVRMVTEQLADAALVNRLYSMAGARPEGVRPTGILLSPIPLHTAFAANDRGRDLEDAFTRHVRDRQRAGGWNVDSLLAAHLGTSRRDGVMAPGRAPAAPLPPAEDRAWLDGRPPLRYAVDPGSPPFEMLDGRGRHIGMSADTLRLVGEWLGVRFERVPTRSWAEAVGMLRAGELDFLPCVGITEERREFMLFTDPYLKFARVLVTTHDSGIRRIEDVGAGVVGVQSQSSHQGHVEALGGIRARGFDTFEQAMLALSRGEIDAVVGNLATVTHVMHDLSLTNLRIAGQVGDSVNTLHMGVRDDLPRLREILDRGLDAISPAEEAAIRRRWMPVRLQPPESLELTRSEQEWLMANPVIRVGWDPEWAPVEFADEEGRAQGIASEYLGALADMLGVTFEHTPPRPWPETLDSLRRGEIDMLSCVGWTTGHAAVMEMTEPYLESPVVVITRSEHPYVSGINSLEGRVVAVPAGYATEAWLSQNHPGLRLLRVSDVPEGLDAVRRGEAIGYVGALVTANYYLSRMRGHDLKVAGKTRYVNRLRMGVRKDWPMLVGILDKALDAIPEDDRTAFYRQWVWLRYEHGRNLTLVIQVALLGLLGVLLFVFWNRRLAREVGLRKRAEESLEASHAALRTSYEELREIEEQRENLVHMIVHDMRSPLTVITGAVEAARDAGDKAPEMLRLARAGAGELERMVNALLDINRMESGEMPVQREPARVDHVARRALEAVGPVAEAAGVAVRIEAEAVEALIDIDLIHRVFLNLLGNAIKACRNGQRVTVRVRSVDGRVRGEVEDTGKGIDPRDHARIFQKFAQVDKNKRSASSGLGLAFCRLAVEAHDGMIGVESQPGEGSRFWFEIPADRRPAAESTPQAGQADD